LMVIGRSPEFGYFRTFVPLLKGALLYDGTSLKLGSGRSPYEMYSPLKLLLISLSTETHAFFMVLHARGIPAFRRRGAGFIPPQ
jgi:hypothetical protein